MMHGHENGSVLCTSGVLYKMKKKTYVETTPVCLSVT